MNEKFDEMAQLLRMRAEIKDLFDGPNPGRWVLRWLMRRRGGVLIVPLDREVYLRAAAAKRRFTSAEVCHATAVEFSERFALQEKLQRRCERRYERDNGNDEEAKPDLVHSK